MTARKEGVVRYMTEERKAEAIALFKGGMRVRRIATKLKVPNDNSVRQVIVRAGLDPVKNWTGVNKRPKIEALLARNWKVAKIAAKLGVGEAYVRRIKANGRTH